MSHQNHQNENQTMQHDKLVGWNHSLHQDCESYLIRVMRVEGSLLLSELAWLMHEVICLGGG